MQGLWHRFFLQILYGISDVKLDGFDNNAWLETKKLILKHVTQVELDFELAYDLMQAPFHYNWWLIAQKTWTQPEFLRGDMTGSQ